jgi:hypothetical protein
MFAQGFKRRMLASLIRAGLATAQRENMKTGGKPIEVIGVMITDGSRKAKRR